MAVPKSIRSSPPKASPAALERREEVKDAFSDEVRRLQKAQALLIATQFAANHDVEFDASDAMAVIVVIVDEVIDGLDKVEVAL
jgi:hypothetical protein